MAAYVRVAGSQGRHFAAVCRTRAPAYLCSSSRITLTNRLNLEDGCFSPHSHCYPPASFQQQRQYTSVGGAVKKAGAGWFRRKLYTLLIIAGVSGGALIYVSLTL